jgi:hemerythrin superfamily protein
MNAIAMLKKDHRELLWLIKKALRGTGARDQQKLVRSIVKELSVHIAAEEELVYPLIRKRANKLDASVLKALEEHHLMKVTLRELDGMKTKNERIVPKLEILLSELATHAGEEEETILPALERVCRAGELDRLGRMIEKAKKVAPTHPHPFAADEPPANVVSGFGAALFDRARDSARDLAGRMRHAVVVRPDGRRTRATTAAKRRARVPGRRPAHA